MKNENESLLVEIRRAFGSRMIMIESEEE